MSEEKRTPLFERHVEARAKMVPFAGYSMPIEYAGIVSEHRAVRTAMGIFDLSHMGEFTIHGEGALDAVDHLVTNEVRNLEVGQARYTPMCFENGGIIDDLLVYRYPDHVMLVVNASNIDKDRDWIVQHLPPGVELKDVSDDIALIAVQGPKASAFLQTLTDVDLAAISYYHFAEGTIAGVELTISRTGYTGEDGLELYVPSAQAVQVWDSLIEAGEGQGLTLIGLGARDTLRLEAGLALYGNDITDQTSPLEAGLGWTVKLAGREFVSSSFLSKQKESGVDRRLVAFQMLDRAIPRPRFRVWSEGNDVGEVTSGTFSPTFAKGIGMAYLPREKAKVGTLIEIDVRGTRHPAEIVRRPIYQRQA